MSKAPTNGAECLHQLLKKISPSGKPEILYHYTSASGMLGILETQHIHASDIRFLNDSQEFELAISRVRESIDERIAEAQNQYDKGLYLTLKDGIPEIGDVRVYVTSFSTRDDDLSQWRGYCPSHGGYAIGFSPAAISQKRGEDQFLARCVYKESEQTELVEDILQSIEALAENLRSEQRRDKDRVYRESHKAFTHLVAVLAPVFKHSSFKDEDEWRVVSTAAQFADKTECYRLGKSLVVPYFPSDLRNDKGQGSPKRIVVGPTPFPELAAESVRRVLATQKLGAEVEISGIPYRAW